MIDKYESTCSQLFAFDFNIVPLFAIILLLVISIAGWAIFIQFERIQVLEKQNRRLCRKGE